MTTILLDIDGVVNIMGIQHGAWPQWRQEMVRPDLEPDQFAIVWAPAVVEAFRQFDAREDTQVLLCSTWCGQHNGLLSTLDLPIRAAWRGSVRHAWRMKESAAGTFLSYGPVVWIDDDLGRRLEIPEGDHDVLAIKPNPDTGLMPDDIAAVRNFLEERS